MKKLIYLIVVSAVSLIFLTGCQSVMDKFIRKKKEEPRTQKYYAVHKLDVKPTLELYTKRYVYWRNWHTEMLKVLNDVSQKRRATAIDQEIVNLSDMWNMLEDE
ncbi:MAG: hypothetical protein HQL28_02435, partial [Candidatus Omnitrophica bacterium]|nr:hypothetical protein [Candidatus Omnitrophota bacterium]